MLDNDIVGQKLEKLTDAQRAGTIPSNQGSSVIRETAMEGGMFRNSGIAVCRENRILSLKMLNHVANQGVDNCVYLIHRLPTEYCGSQTVDLVEQTLVLCVDHGVARKEANVVTVRSE